MQRQPGDAIVVRRSIRFIGKIVMGPSSKTLLVFLLLGASPGALIGKTRTTATTASPRTNPTTAHVTLSAATAPPRPDPALLRR
jgi:hypothetical protein